MIKPPFLQLNTAGYGPGPAADTPVSFKSAVTNDVFSKVNTGNEETEKEYCYGGYHPVKIHEKLGPRKNYKIIRKLGWGQFSTVWLALDTIHSQYYALKIVKSSESYTEAALDEISLLERVANKDPTHPGHKYLVKLYDWFYHNGPNGQHVVMAFEVLGESLLNLLTTFHNEKTYKEMNLKQFGKTYGGLPLNVIKKITRQICLALDYLHRVCGLIHTDLKPENILIEIKDVEKFIALLDLPEPLDPHENHSRTPIKNSNPLPSPLLRSESYSHFHMSPKSKSRSKNKSSMSPNSSDRSSINYYENYTTDSMLGSSSSVSPTLNVHHPSTLHHSCTVTTSEADSDSEEELEEHEEGFTDDGNHYQQNFFVPKSFKFKENSTVEEMEDLESLINVKIADLGNACAYNYHPTNNIQTRQYRSPEIILGSKTWGASADSWSLACLVFELITGDFLFSPSHSETFCKDEDHLAQMIELLNPPKDELITLLKSNCKYKEYFFEIYKDEMSDGGIEVELRKIKKLKFWSLSDVLIDKYHFENAEAHKISDFLLPLLRLNPKDRADLGGWSNHSWLDDPSLSEEENEEIGFVDRPCGSCGEDIKGWHKTYVRPDHHNHHHHHHHHR